MLNTVSEKLAFILENIYTATNASGLAIIDSIGNVVAECGNVDLEVISDTVRVNCNKIQDILKFFTGTQNEEFFSINKGVKGSYLLAKINSKLFFVVFYPKQVDLLNISTELESFTQKIRNLFSKEV